MDSACTVTIRSGSMVLAASIVASIGPALTVETTTGVSTSSPSSSPLATSSSADARG